MRCNRKIPVQQIQKLSGGSVASDEFANKSGCKAQHGNASVQSFHCCQCSRIPWSGRSESFTEPFQRFVSVCGFAQLWHARTMSLFAMVSRCRR
jgi:hypothetical protein